MYALRTAVASAMDAVARVASEKPMLHRSSHLATTSWSYSSVVVAARHLAGLQKPLKLVFGLMARCLQSMKTSPLLVTFLCMGMCLMTVLAPCVATRFCSAGGTKALSGAENMNS